MVRSTGAPPDWACSGVIGDMLVQQAVGRHGREVLSCLSTGGPLPAGSRLTVRMRVAADGSVDAAHVSGIEAPAVVDCAGRAALAFRFPPPVGGSCAVVEAPFAMGGAAGPG
jgi:hypothetical protein